MFETAGAIVEALGGPALVTSDLGLSNRSTVGSWSQRGSIPPEYWPELVHISERKGVSGITLQALADLHARPAPGALVSEARA